MELFSKLQLGERKVRVIGGFLLFPTEPGNGPTTIACLARVFASLSQSSND